MYVYVKNLEGVLVTLRLPKLLGNLAKLRDGNLVAFANPSLNHICGASLGQSESKDSAFEVIVFHGVVFDGIAPKSTRTEHSRNFALAEGRNLRH